jgi:hypothetical protein
VPKQSNGLRGRSEDDAWHENKLSPLPRSGLSLSIPTFYSTSIGCRARGRLNEQVSPADVEEEKKLLLKSEPPTMEGLLDWYESQPNSPEREKFLQNYFSRSVVLPGSLDPEPSN